MNSTFAQKANICSELLEDATSRIVYFGQVNYNMTGEYQHIAKMLRTLLAEHPDSISSQRLRAAFDACAGDINQMRPVKKFVVDHDSMFFEPGIIETGKNEVFVDCGAMDMSTSLEFAYHTGDTYKGIVAFEPDPLCYEICEDNRLFFSKDKRDSVTILNVGVHNINGMLPFHHTAEIGNSHIVDKSSESIPVRKIDDVPECADATFLKIHTEGTELDVLAGAEKTILKNRPKIAVSCYHNITELVEIPAYLKKLCPDYRLFMRHYSTGTTESVLYAVCPGR